MTLQQEDDDDRDSAPGIFVFLFGVVLGNLNGLVLAMLWDAIQRWVAW